VRRVLRWVLIAFGGVLLAIGGLRLVAIASGGPLGPIPGGALSGESATGDPPLDALGAARQIELQVDPASPRSMTTWVLVHDGHVYVPAAFAETKTWPGLAASDGRVVLRLGGQLWDRRAVRMTDAAMLSTLIGELATKYGFDPADAGTDKTWVFRLDPPAAPELMPAK